ncbi:MAG TPA: Crp/Fnr family transcriptional regulator [Stellaceae bacterium]|nr:Crp/Fnr family transcriptional regulator [Stellaceae bacterium]
MRAAQQPTATSRTPVPLTHRLAQLMVLSPEETQLLEELQAATRPVRRNREIVSEGRPYDSLFILIEGFSNRYRILRDGRRQVLNIVLPGDLIGFPGCFFENALYSITALTEARVAPVPFTRLLGLFQTHARLATAIFWSFSREAAMYAEHLIDVGRRSALERVAHFLLELLNRLQVVGLADDNSYRLPLTQEVMGDALGLSVPHVNRTLRQLRDDGLVAIEEQRVVIHDLEGLSALADFERSYLGRFRMPEWLAKPPP